MNPKEKKNISSLAIQLSLAGLLFFSPFVQLLLKKSNFEISDYERTFVKGYLRLWWIAIYLLLISIVLWVFSYAYPIGMIPTLYMIFMSILIAGIFLGGIGIFTQTTIDSSFEGSETKLKPLIGNKQTLLLSYLPLYTIYLRYQLHSFDKPNIILKESILLRGLFSFLCITGNIFLISLLLILIIARMVTIAADIDIIPSKIKQFLNTLFYKNPEEIRWYIIWSLVWCIKTLFHSSSSLADTIAEYKQPYTYLYDIRTFSSIQWQYLIALLGIGISARQRSWFPLSGFTGTAAVLILGRYVLMIIVWKHLPALPGIREIITLIPPLQK